jgi:hypothetical protein
VTVKTGPVLSVVDYDAWNKGYMPPSEHILIDKLAYRGARVNLSTPISRDHQLWVVVEGPPMTTKQRKQLLEIMKIWFDDEPEESKDAAQTPPTDTGSVT